jgi:hypothetical protein
MVAAAWGIGCAVSVPDYLANTMFGWMAVGMSAVLAGLAVRR